MEIGISLTLAARADGVETTPAPSNSKMTLSHASGTGVGFTRIDTSDGADLNITWADGSSVTIASGNGASVSYGSATAGSVVVTSSSGSDITRVDLASGNALWSFSTAALPNALERFVMYQYNAIRLDVDNLPSAIVYFALQSSTETGTGNFKNFPTTAETIQITGLHDFVVDTSDLWPGLRVLRLGNSGLSATPLTGAVSELPATLTNIWFDDFRASGELGDFPASVNQITLDNATNVTFNSLWGTSNVSTFKFGAGLSSGEVDALLTLLTGVTSWTTWGQGVDLSIGGNAARTSASDSAVATIEANGATVVTA